MRRKVCIGITKFASARLLIEARSEDPAAIRMLMLVFEIMTGIIWICIFAGKFGLNAKRDCFDYFVAS